LDGSDASFARNLEKRSNTRRRILVLTPRNPYPVIGGDRVRIYHLARMLSEHYDLTLLTLCRSKRERDAPLPTDGVFSQVHRVVMPFWESWSRALAAISTPEPLQVAFYESDAFRKAVNELAPQHDGVIAHLIRTAQYARDLPCVRMLEMTDAISLTMQRVATQPLGYFDPRRLLYALEGPRVQQYEREVARDFDVVSLTSVVDKRFAFGRGASDDVHPIVIRNGSDAPQAQPPPLADRNPGEIVFLGNMHSLPNFDAAWFFATKVLPLVRERHPHAVFRVIGPSSRRAARRLAGLPGVRMEGVVADLEQALATARIGVCPTRVGSGIQNKILDYFGHRLAVVCSPLGTQGLDAALIKDLLVAESADDWAAKVCRLLEDGSLAQQLADAGRVSVLRHHRWDQCCAPLVARLDALFEQRASREATGEVLALDAALAADSPS